MRSIENIKYKKRWDRGCYIAFVQDSSKILEDDTLHGLVQKCEKEGWTDYVIHKFKRTLAYKKQLDDSD